MPFNDPFLNLMAAAGQAAAPYVAIHYALPDAAGSNQALSARRPAGWPVPANGDFGVLANISFSGGAANGPAKYLGFWSQLAVGGTYWGYLGLVGDQAFNASGLYTLTSAAIPGFAV